jgi:hypothetical protein
VDLPVQQADELERHWDQDAQEEDRMRHVDEHDDAH